MAIDINEIVGELLELYPNLTVEQLVPHAGMFKIGVFTYFLSFADRNKDTIIRTFIKDVENHERRLSHPVATTQTWCG